MPYRGYVRLNIELLRGPDSTQHLFNMSVEYLREADVQKCLRWSALVPKMESALSQLSDKSVVQPVKLVTPVPGKNGVLLTMPAYSRKNNALGCKIVTSFSGNKTKGLPSVIATVLLLDGDTGKPKAIMEGNMITAWRTAAASVAATKHLHSGKKETLCILGAGEQAKSHAQAMHDQFKFSKIKIWNRTPARAIKLCEELDLGSICTVHSTAQDAASGADVICTTTGADQPILESAWVKDGAHINAVGANRGHHSELSVELHRRGAIVVDSMETALVEFADLIEQGIPLWGDVGSIINGKRSKPGEKVTMFYSLGMAIEDVLSAELIYENRLAENKTKYAYTVDTP
ncbi:hypothetical protein GE061_006674 [Apolygus lucorum]|uniref:Ketimine reductase mu-crystallin n=1 Tax=Apolygus lucorum TaxID=248454 RepID=A0A6A4J1K8_APOLU|nr:hypothetical protein GE061_006674 [Apolygus lucorum]